MSKRRIQHDKEVAGNRYGLDEPGLPAMSRAFSLVEVTLAIGVAGFALLAVLGILGTGVTISSDVIEGSAATSLIESIAGDIRASEQAGLTTTRVHRLPLDGSGTPQRIVYGGRAFRVSVEFSPPASTNSALKYHRIRASWPDQVDANKARGFIEMPVFIYNGP